MAEIEAADPHPAHSKPHSKPHREGRSTMPFAPRAMGAVQRTGLSLVVFLCLFPLASVGTMPQWTTKSIDQSLSDKLSGMKSDGGTAGDAGLVRSKSTVWYEGYKAGCMQFLQTYIPDQRDGKPLVIGVAGGSGSGKTTIKDVIVEHLSEENVAVLPHDNYYRHRPELSDEERDNINFDHPESLETELMVEHLKALMEGECVDIPVYDFATHLRKEKETVRINSRPIIVVEGILIFTEPALRDLMNLKVFVDVEADRRLIRRIDRDMIERGRTFSSIVQQYLLSVKPMHDAFVEPSKGYADLIIPFGGRNVAAIQVLMERLKTHLRNNLAYTASQSKNGLGRTQSTDILDRGSSESGKDPTILYKAQRVSLAMPNEISRRTDSPSERGIFDRVNSDDSVASGASGFTFEK